MKNLGIKILCLLLSFLFISCDRNDPVGGDFIDERAGDVVSDTFFDFDHRSFSEYSNTGFSDFLYAGKEQSAKSIAILSYKRPLTKTLYDSVVFLFPVDNKGTESVYLRRFQGEFWEDSIIKEGDITLEDTLSSSPIWTENNDTVSFSIKKKTFADTLINVALCSEGETGVFYSRNSENPPILKLFRGPLLEVIEPIKDAFVDTVFIYNTDHIFISGGSHPWKDTIFLVDTFPTEIFKVNYAVLHLPVISFWGPDPNIVVRYRDALTREYRIETDTDTLKIEVTRFIDDWVTNEEDRFLVIEGREGRLFTATFSKDISLEIVYTEKTETR